MAETEKHDRLRAELARLYLLPAPPGSAAGAQDSALVSPSGTVRALVLELVQPPGWEVLARIWHGVQNELDLPAPAIAVSGLDALQLWFSLEKPVGDEEESEFGQFIADEKAISPEAAADETLRNEALQDVLNSLSYRERRVLELRYGLGGEQPRTLDEVGRTFNVTRERIRQIENQALQKLAGMVDVRGLAEVA
jgi:RNA polymerase sigma factor (sigma-70 family)